MANGAKPLIAIQGERGSFSHEVAERLFGKGVAILECETFPKLFASTFGRAAKADAALVPIENALYGSIHQNFDLLLKHRATIFAEAYHRIELCLIGLSGKTIERGSTVLVHPVAAGQCTGFLKKHRLKVQLAADTAGAVRDLVERKPAGTYAIASAHAAKLYGAQVLARGIEDDAKNFTRFLAVSEKPRQLKRSGDGHKTSLAFVLPNTPGSLFRALGAFSLRDVDLAKLESRPMRGRPFEYLFYLDVVGSLSDRNVQRAVEHLREIVEQLWVLGSYPRHAARE
jgi:prephenate dehydratase